MKQLNSSSSSHQVIRISRSERWSVHQRLTELEISSTCLPDGSLSVEINHPLSLIQLRSVLQQSSASRYMLLRWLEQCWQQS
jgi:hypothetical protein